MDHGANEPVTRGHKEYPPPSPMAATVTVCTAFYWLPTPAADGTLIGHLAGRTTIHSFGRGSIAASRMGRGNLATIIGILAYVV